MRYTDIALSIEEMLTAETIQGIGADHKDTGVAVVRILGYVRSLEEENAMLRKNLTLHRYGHDEIEAACGGEVALVVRKDVMKRRAAIISDRAHD